MEERPDTFSDEQHTRVISQGKSSSPGSQQLKLVVLDASGWMGRWKGYFDRLGIPFLRSPLTVHPSPKDPQVELVRYATDAGGRCLWC